MAMGAGQGASLVTRLGVEGLPQYIGGMRQAAEEAEKTASRSNKAFGNMAGMKSFGQKMTRNVTLPIVAAGAASFHVFAGFDKTMRQFGASADVGGARLKGFTTLAMKMGKETSFSAGEAASAMLELSKGGMTAAEIKAGALKQTLTLAAAGGIGLADAAGYMSNTLNMFGLDSRKAGAAAAALAGGANASTASVESLGQGLSQVGLAAKNSGLSMEETVAMLAVLDDNAVKGSDGGTSLKAMLNSLTPATDGAREAMKKYNLEFTNSNGTFKNGAQIAEELRRNLSGLKEAERAAALERIFGSDGMRAATALMNGGSAAVKEYTKATSDLSQAEKMAKTNTEGAAGSIEQMMGSLETAGIAIGTAIAPAVMQLAGFVTDAANAFTSLPSGVQTALIGLAGFAAVTGPMLVGIANVVSAVSTLKTAMSGLSMAGLLTNPIALAGAAAVVAVVGISSMAGSVKGLGYNSKNATEAIKELDAASRQLADDNLKQKEADLQLAVAKKQHAAATANLTKLKKDGKASSEQIRAAELAEAQASLAVERATISSTSAREANQKTLNKTVSTLKTNQNVLKEEAAIQDKARAGIEKWSNAVKDGSVDAATGNREIARFSKALSASQERAEKARNAISGASRELRNLGPAAAGSADKVREINNLLSGLPKDVRVNVGVMYREINKPRNSGTYAPAVPGHNSGGLIEGRGPNKDTVIAALTKGEYVMDRNTVDKFGPGFFKSLQGFKNGGLVKKSLAQANTRARIAASPAASLKQAEKEHKAAVTAQKNIEKGGVKKDEKDKYAQAKDNVKAKADAVVAAKKALADFNRERYTGRTEGSLAGEETRNRLAGLRANSDADLTNDIAATDSEIATNNKRIAGLQKDISGTKDDAAKKELQSQLNDAIERQITLDQTRNGLIEQQNDAIKQAALEAPKATMVLRDAQTNLALAYAKATPQIEDDLAAFGQALKDEEERRYKINAAFAAATTDAERADLTNQLAESVNATTALTSEMKNATSATDSMAAELEQARRKAEIEKTRADLSESAIRAFRSTGDIGTGGANALAAVAGTTIINNINALSGYDPAVQNALAQTSNTGNSNGSSADILYSGRQAV